MGRHYVKRAAIATVLAVLGAGASVHADEQVWMWQYELGFGRNQTVSSFNLGVRPVSAVTAFDSHANGTTRFRLPLYSTDPTTWSLLRFRARGEDSAGTIGFGTVVLGAVVAWQIYEAADAAGDRAVEETLKDLEFDIPDIQFPETESFQTESGGS